MQAIEFLQGFGWICVAAYCLNGLGLVPTSWINAAQSRAGIPVEAVSSPSPSSSPVPSATPSPTTTPQESSGDKQFSTQQ
ncbi:MAG: hypothetical protein KME15_20150 [Drouetiella hepatica Uher 2000/2452]|jgi:hypothetical protein|uniref:Uncharacterized protein n=1 Tax=Drouetiella hepatica Uher 2000/2452 TaxID=904376 RepID=A0A951UP73_9CYAN|nr:hypothetical protein [Drouetiella hepatica Uher 2000/2452]